MKARTLFQSKGRNPEFDYQEFSRCLRDGKPYKVDIDIVIEKGVIIDAPDCWKLVVVGAAEPADKECRIASGMLTDDEMAVRQTSQDKLRRGMLSNKPEENASATETLDENVSAEAANA